MQNWIKKTQDAWLKDDGTMKVELQLFVERVRRPAREMRISWIRE